MVASLQHLCDLAECTGYDGTTQLYITLLQYLFMQAEVYIYVYSTASKHTENFIICTIARDYFKLHFVGLLICINNIKQNRSSKLISVINEYVFLLNSSC